MIHYHITSNLSGLTKDFMRHLRVYSWGHSLRHKYYVEHPNRQSTIQMVVWGNASDHVQKETKMVKLITINGKTIRGETPRMGKTLRKKSHEEKPQSESRISKTNWDGRKNHQRNQKEPQVETEKVEAGQKGSWRVTYKDPRLTIKSNAKETLTGLKNNLLLVLRIAATIMAEAEKVVELVGRVSSCNSTSSKKTG